MSDPLYIERDGHRSWIKWHRGRRTGSDPVFTGRRILEALRLGASVEVDLVVTADGGFAVLHDHSLDRETTGSGPVNGAHDAAIRALKLRDNSGNRLDEPVMLLEDLCRVAAAGTVSPDALLQLDLKEELGALSQTAVDRFAECVRPIAGNTVLSSGDAGAVARLAEVVPGIQTGFDASDEARVKQALESGDHRSFVDWAVSALPGATMIYLYWEIPLLFADAGFDLIGAFHEKGCRIDAWTIRDITPDSIKQVDRLLGLKVDQITTDDPEGLSAAFA